MYSNIYIGLRRTGKPDRGLCRIPGSPRRGVRGGDQGAPPVEAIQVRVPWLFTSTTTTLPSPSGISKAASGAPGVALVEAYEVP